MSSVTTKEFKGIRVAFVGCTHGQLDLIYEDCAYSAFNGRPVDLVLCCGDFEAVRNQYDLDCLAGPPKYHFFKDFHKYYSGRSVAPILMIFIGGNHEASNYMQSLYYGGWAAPNIYFLGHSGALQFAGLRIAGFSGIYKKNDFCKGRYERHPFDSDSLRSVFHVRKFDLWKLSMLKGPIDVMMSHDWPSLTQTAKEAMTKLYPNYKQEISSHDGCPYYDRLMCQHRPVYWVSGHMHVHFEHTFFQDGEEQQQRQAEKRSSQLRTKSYSESKQSTKTELLTDDTKKQSNTPVKQTQSERENSETRFIALDKTIRGRHYLHILEFPNCQQPKQLRYDADMLSIHRCTHKLLPTTKQAVHFDKMHMVSDLEREREWISTHLNSDQLIVPIDTFVRTVRPRTDSDTPKDVAAVFAALPEKEFGPNPQTIAFLKLLQLESLPLFSLPSSTPTTVISSSFVSSSFSSSSSASFTSTAPSSSSSSSSSSLTSSASASSASSSSTSHASSRGRGRGRSRVMGGWAADSTRLARGGRGRRGQ